MRESRADRSLVPFYQYDEDQFFRSDRTAREHCAAGDVWLSAARRCIANDSRRHCADSRKPRTESRICNSPKPIGFRFSSAATSAEHWPPVPFMNRRPGSPYATSTEICLYDVTGSYGVNLFGYDFYKECIERALERCARSGRYWALPSDGRR